MGLPVEINNLMLGSLGGYTVGRSLRFRSSASAYLNRTPASASNRKTWTWSGWVKRGTLGVNQHIFGGWDGSNNATGIYFATNDTIEVFSIQVSPTTYSLQLDTTQVFRDPSAWYHFVLAIDTTQATASNRAKLYVNGVQITALSTASYPSQNADLFVNTNAGHFLSRMSWSAASYLDGYLAEVNFIDGQALTPSSFGAYDTNGVWQPKKYTGTYGTNGFYLPFSDNSALTTASNVGLGKDFSGNNNYWVTNNISITAGTTYDSMIDSPTVSASSSNYAVLNPTQPSGGTYQAGNLQFLSATAGQWKSAVGTIFASSGKWYWEITNVVLPTAGYVFAGAVSSTINLASSTLNGASAQPISGVAEGWAVGSSGGNFVKGNNGTATTLTAGTDSVGDVWMIAVDVDASKIWFGRNGTWFASGDPATGANAAFTNLSGSIGPACSAYLNTGTTAGLNCGQRPFTYTPPSGFKALNTYNLPAPSIANGAQYMAATTFTGNASTNTINNGTNTTIGTSFQPDMVWLKSRSNANNHTLYDSIRGINDILYPNLTNAAVNSANNLTSFNSNGYTLGANENSNDNSGESSVGWSWKGGGTGVTNNSGTITSTVSANTTAGFSIVTYTGTGSLATVGHGLGVAPDLIIWKNRSSVQNWVTYHRSLGAAGNVYLNLTAGYSADSTTHNNTAPTSSVFTIATSGAVNGSTNNIVAYCFSAVRGYSAFGSYTGNGSTDGPFVFTNFRPRWLMIKRTDSAEGWHIHDTSRNTYNPAGTRLQAESSGADDNTQSTTPDILSNGFKIRSSWAGENASGGTYVYACFSENPFNYSRAR